MLGSFSTLKRFLIQRLVELEVVKVSKCSP